MAKVGHKGYRRTPWLPAAIELGNHPVHTWEFADEAARLSAINFTANDVHKMAMEMDTGKLYVLMAHDPVVWENFKLPSMVAKFSLDPIHWNPQSHVFTTDGLRLDTPVGHGGCYTDPLYTFPQGKFCFYKTGGAIGGNLNQYLLLARFNRTAFGDGRYTMGTNASGQWIGAGLNQNATYWVTLDTVSGDLVAYWYNGTVKHTATLDVNAGDVWGLYFDDPTSASAQWAQFDFDLDSYPAFIPEAYRNPVEFVKF